MTIRLYLQNNGFDIDDRGANFDFPTFVRYYEELYIAAFFNSFSGDFYGIRFHSIDELFRYRHGEIKLSIKPVSESWCVSSGMIYREKIQVFPLVNLSNIQSLRDLRICFEAFDRMITDELNGVSKHGFEYGERVFYTRDGSRYEIGTVVGFLANKITVKKDSGITFDFSKSYIKKIKA
jgi:hypothetical protein